MQPIGIRIIIFLRPTEYQLTEKSIAQYDNIYVYTLR